MLRLEEMTWPEVAALDRQRAVPILPVGAMEAHGPHLPLSTDRWIAVGMAEAGAEMLAERGLLPLLLPALDYTPAPFARAFAGTLSLRRETGSAILSELGSSLATAGFRWLAVANAHLDPANLGAIRDAGKQLEGSGLELIFPDITRKPWALRLGEEFLSGACHAGRYEGSMVMARRPDLVRQNLARELRPNPASLVTAIRAGKDSFAEAGGPEAYFGDPAAASTDEGQTTLNELGKILAEAVLDKLGTSDP